MKIRSLALILGAALAAVMMAPGAIAADLTDVGYIDQADLANMPIFVGANRQLAGYKALLDGQFNNAIKRARTDADRQRISMVFQQQFTDKQREIIGPLFQRAQLAIAAVATSRNLSVVVDKRIVIYGGQDITKDVESLFTSPQAISPPAASPPPSEIGFVDQSALDGLPKVKSANDMMSTFAAAQREVYSAKIAQARSNTEKQQIFAEYNKTLTDKQDQLLKPLVDATKSATSSVARRKNLMLVVDRADVIYGGTDITTDVQNELGK
jgi:outer membrane protein